MRFAGKALAGMRFLKGLTGLVGAVKLKIRMLKRTRRPERGTSYIEIAIMMLIMTILLISLTTAIKEMTKASLMAKERSRAMALAQDKIAEIKKLGYDNLRMKVSRYEYPTVPDPDFPLSQRKDLLPFPETMPDEGEDPWTPEYITSGKVEYWRHVKVKCVESIDGVLYQKPEAGGGEPGGTDDSSNLMHIEIAVTWRSRAGNKIVKQVRATTLVANMAVVSGNYGSIAGTVFDDDVLPANSDDSIVIGQVLVVHTTHPGTGESFSVPVDEATGAYELTSLPDGDYIVKLAGGAGYANSAYADGNTDFDGTPVPSGDALAITIGTGSMIHRNKGIWTQKLLRVRVHGKFIGADVGDIIRVECDDGVSEPLLFSVPVPDDCTIATPCFFELENVVWPSSPRATTLTLENITQQRYTTASLFMDTSSPTVLPQQLSPTMGSATDFYIGHLEGDLPPAVAAIYMTPKCPSFGGSECIWPEQGGWPPSALTVTVLCATTYSNSPATILVRVKEYYEGSVYPLQNARVILDDGTSVTMWTDSVGFVVVANVAPAAAGAVVAHFSVTSGGYTTEAITIEDKIDPVAVKWLDESGDLLDVGSPPSETVILRRIATVSGTVWRTCDGGSIPCGAASEGFPNISITILNPDTEYSISVVTDAAGRFSLSSVIQEITDYTLKPSIGSSYSVVPSSLAVTVDDNGVNFAFADNSDPLEFVLDAINGTINGLVRQGGKPYGKGAIVIATTYTGAFPASIPASVLAGTHNYSTITETDGTFTLKVATGVGDYIVYAFSSDGESSGSTPVTVTADAEVTVADLVIP